MKIAFCSNYLNHHQLPMCESFYKLCGDDFKFIVFAKFNERRKEIGYEDMSGKYDFVINISDSKERLYEGLKFINEADAVIYGSFPERCIEKRLNDNKLTFRYSERIFRKSARDVYNIKLPFKIIRSRLKIKKCEYLLAAGAYSAGDYNLIGAYKNKSFKWGYFPEVKKFDAEEVIKKRRDGKIKLLWVGRMINLKRPEQALYVLKKLREDGIDAYLDYVGTGNLILSLTSLAVQYNVDKYVTFCGAVAYNKVADYMKKADIFLFTSNQLEGWGTVLNEAMGCAAATVASVEAGATLYLAKHGENAFIYDGSKQELYKYAKMLALDENLREGMQKKAYDTMINEWCAPVAAKRFLEFAKNLLSGKTVPYENGPLSISERRSYWKKG